MIDVAVGDPLGDMTSDQTRGRMFGYKEAAASLGAALGPLAGGFIYEYGAPEIAFVANGGILLVTAALVWIWWGRSGNKGVRLN